MTAGNITLIITLFGALIEIAPIKISPLKWIWNRASSDFIEKIQHNSDLINELKIDSDLKDLSTVRNRILALDRYKRDGKTLSVNDICSITHDFDAYDYYKEQYGQVKKCGRSYKINGEIESARKNLLE